MGLRFLTTSVIAIVTAALAPLPSAARQQPDPITDADAYSVYAVAIPQTWADVSKDVLLLQQETEGMEDRWSNCLQSITNAGSEWDAVAVAFRQENVRVRVLEWLLPIDTPYRLVPRAEILADDARLARMYPGPMRYRPESMKYAAVSAVGFNAGKTKAIVSVRLRSTQGMVDIHFMEIRDGKWVNVSLGECRWIVIA
jgi:hypothetical protein